MLFVKSIKKKRLVKKLCSVAVSPKMRRQDYGTKLILHAEHALTSIGCTKINLQVRSTNAPVAAFYKELDYKNLPAH
ncbi:MAG TPA: GNAT family N-acetyltransferase [Burkholderiaceae bacterium]